MTGAGSGRREPHGTEASVVIKDYQPGLIAGIAQDLQALYANVYAEPPYYETESDVRDFAARLTSQLREPSFLLVAAWDKDCLAGYLYGFTIDRNSTRWATTFLSTDHSQQPHDLTGPMVFVSELLVAAGYRGQGIARALHDRFLAARTEQEAVLLAHPDAAPAQYAYRRWGWYRVGAGRPFPGAPLYDTLMKDLPAAGIQRHS